MDGLAEIAIEEGTKKGRKGAYGFLQTLHGLRGLPALGKDRKELSTVGVTNVEPSCATRKLVLWGLAGFRQTLVLTPCGIGSC